jgi:hypothetical protein
MTGGMLTVLDNLDCNPTWRANGLGMAVSLFCWEPI